MNKDYLQKNTVECALCGNSFETIWVRQIYCSDSCRKKMILKNAKERRAVLGSPVYNKKRTDTERYLRIQALKILGNKCVICGYNDIRALHIDHVNGDGHKERSNRKKINRAIVNNTIERERYQLLCANCNWIKRLENNEGTNRKDYNDFLLSHNLNESSNKDTVL